MAYLNPYRYSNPIEFPTNDLIFHLDAKEPSTIELNPGTNEVNNWNSVPPAGRFFVTKTSPHFPIYNGVDNVYFNGRSILQGTTSLGFPSLTELSLFSVFEIPERIQESQMLFTAGWNNLSGSTRTHSPMLYVAGISIYFRIGDYFLNFPGSLEINKKYVASLRYNGSIMEAYVNNILWDSRSADDTFSSIRDYAIGGRAHNTANGFIGNIQHMSMFSKALELLEFKDVNRYLMKRFNIN